MLCTYAVCVFFALGFVTLSFGSQKGEEAKKVTLNVLSSPDNVDALAEISKRFMRMNPDITVDVSPVSWEVLYPQILADINAKTGAFDVCTWDLMTAGSIAKGMLLHLQSGALVWLECGVCVRVEHPASYRRYHFSEYTHANSSGSRTP